MTRKSKKQIQNQAQDGRSMVEMLGVLAIIGVLSIGGIVGYKLAMNHYQASQIAHEMNMMRTDAQIKIAQGTEKLTLGSPYDSGNIHFNNYGTAFACALADDSVIEENVSCQVANAFYIEMKNVSQEICRPLSKLIQGMNELIGFEITTEIIEADNEECQEGDNNIHAVFSAEAVSELVACAEDTDCESESTHYCDPSRHVCVRCYEDSQCEHNQYCENNTCVTCESGVWNGTDCVECTSDDDCTDKTDTPKCNTDTNTCVECIESGDCEEELVCRENTCSLCETEEECQAKGTNYHCSNASICIQCAANQVWDDESRECVECTEDGDCTDTPDTPVCYREEYKCVQCLTYENCIDTPETPQCDEASHTCKSCAEIDSNKPLWAETQCVECTSNDDCLKKGTDKPLCNEENKCKECPKKSFWNGEKCQEGCRKNEHCAEDEYCYKEGGFSCTDEWGTGKDGGSCRKVANDLIPGTVNGETYYGSTVKMNWWSVGRFCDALDKTPVTRADLGCGNKSSESDGYCTNAIMSGLKGFVYIEPSWPWYWLESYSNQCYAYDINLVNGSLSHPLYNNKNTLSEYALCKSKG